MLNVTIQLEDKDKRLETYFPWNEAMGMVYDIIKDNAKNGTLAAIEVKTTTGGVAKFKFK